MRIIGWIGAGLMMCTVATPASATTFFEQEFTCPVGGEKFSSPVMGSNSYFGARPDGKPYSPMPVSPLVECPSNGFLLFDRTFTPAEVATLSEAVASPEYGTLRTAETQHYRAWWLMNRIDRDPYSRAAVLLQATWESDDDAARKARYQTAFVDAAKALDPTTSKDDAWFWLNLRAANALRELGRFDEGAALLAQIDQPDRLPTDADAKDGARKLIDGLRALTTERNRVAEPANLIPVELARERCQANDLTTTERETCATVPKPDATYSRRSRSTEAKDRRAVKNTERAARDARLAAEAAARDGAEEAARNAKRR